MVAEPGPEGPARWERRIGWAMRVVVVAMAIYHAVAGDVLLAGYCVLALAVLLVPPLLARTSGASVPVELEIVLVLLLVTDMVLGKWLGLYDRLVYWDKVLHLGNSVLLGFLGFMFLYVLRATDRLRVSAPTAIVVAAWLTLGLGAAWEIGEFAMDALLGTITQGSPNMGPLADTMWDLILDAVGGLAAGAAGVAYLRKSSRARRVARWFPPPGPRLTIRAGCAASATGAARPARDPSSSEAMARTGV